MYSIVKEWFRFWFDEFFDECFNIATLYQERNHPECVTIEQNGRTSHPKGMLVAIAFLIGEWVLYRKQPFLFLHCLQLLATCIYLTKKKLLFSLSLSLSIEKQIVKRWWMFFSINLCGNDFLSFWNCHNTWKGSTTKTYTL